MSRCAQDAVARELTFCNCSKSVLHKTCGFLQAGKCLLVIGLEFFAQHQTPAQGRHGFRTSSTWRHRRDGARAWVLREGRKPCFRAKKTILNSVCSQSIRFCDVTVSIVSHSDMLYRGLCVCARVCVYSKGGTPRRFVCWCFPRRWECYVRLAIFLLISPFLLISVAVRVRELSPPPNYRCCAISCVCRGKVLVRENQKWNRSVFTLPCFLKLQVGDTKYHLKYHLNETKANYHLNSNKLTILKLSIIWTRLKENRLLPYSVESVFPLERAPRNWLRVHWDQC